MDIGTETERITVEPLESPIPHEQPAPTKTPDTEIKPNREPAHANLLTPPPPSGEQVVDRSTEHRPRNRFKDRP